MVTRTHKRALHRHASQPKHALPKHALHRHALPKHALPKHALHRRTRKQRGGAKLNEYSILQFNDVEPWPSKVYVRMTKPKHGYLPFESNCKKTFFDRSLSDCNGYFHKDAFNEADIQGLNDDSDSVLIEYKLYKISNIDPPVVKLLNNPTFFDINFGMPSNTTYTDDILSKDEKKSGIIHFNEKNDEHKYIYKHFTFYKKKPKLEIVSPPSTEQPKEKYTVFTDFDNTLTENKTTFVLEYEDKEKKKQKTKIAGDDVDADTNWAEIYNTFNAIKKDNNTDIVVVTSSFQKVINETLSEKNNNVEAKKYQNVFKNDINMDVVKSIKAYVIGIPIDNSTNNWIEEYTNYNYNSDTEKATKFSEGQGPHPFFRSFIKYKQIENYLKELKNGATEKRSLFIDDDITNCNLIHEKFPEMLVIWAKNINENPKKGNYLKNLEAMKLAIEYIKNNKDNENIEMTDTSVKDENDDKNLYKLWTSERIIEFIKNNKVSEVETDVVEDAVVDNKGAVVNEQVHVVKEKDDAVNVVVPEEVDKNVVVPEEVDKNVVPVVEVDNLIKNIKDITDNSINTDIEEKKPDLDKLINRFDSAKLKTNSQEIIKALNDLNIIIRTVDETDVTSGTTTKIKQRFNLNDKILAINRKLDDILYKKNPQNPQYTKKRDVGGKRISKRKTRKVKKQGKIKAIINKQRLNKRLSHKRLWRSRHMRSRLLRRRLTRKTK